MARTLDVYLGDDIVGQLVQDDGGQMSFNVTSIDGQGSLPDGGPANFYCGHGHLWASVPDITAPSRVIAVDAGF